jgi:hypothetical protein
MSEQYVGFNGRLAAWITNKVDTMTACYAATIFQFGRQPQVSDRSGYAWPGPTPSQCPRPLRHARLPAWRAPHRVDGGGMSPAGSVDGRTGSRTRPTRPGGPLPEVMGPGRVDRPLVGR